VSIIINIAGGVNTISLFWRAVIACQLYYRVIN